MIRRINESSNEDDIIFKPVVDLIIHQRLTVALAESLDGQSFHVMVFLGSDTDTGIYLGKSKETFRDFESAFKWAESHCTNNNRELLKVLDKQATSCLHKEIPVYALTELRDFIK